MIELRWIERVEPIISFPPSAAYGRVVRVLQYRQWQVGIDASGAITPLPLPIEWTDWQDVPLVTDKDAP